MQRLALAALRPARSISALVYLLTLVIGATAFVIPSTSGRAAVLLPVFLALADALDDQRLVRALALMFPSIILLSACASLTGAGAHVVALEFIALLPGAKTIGYLEWIKFGLPIALLSSLAAAALILRMFLTSEERARPPKLPEPPTQPVSVRELAIAGGRCGDGSSLGNVGLACCRDRDCRPRVSPAADAAARIGHWPEVGTQWRGVGTHSVPDRHVGDRRCVDRVGRSRIDRGLADQRDAARGHPAACGRGGVRRRRCHPDAPCHRVPQCARCRPDTHARAFGGRPRSRCRRSDHA